MDFSSIFAGKFFDYYKKKLRGGVYLMNELPMTANVKQQQHAAKDSAIRFYSKRKSELRI